MLNLSAIAGRIPRRGAARILGQDCVLCRSESDASLVCASCEGLLTRVEDPCSCCGIPVPGGGRCGECLLEPPPFETVVCAYAYRFPLDRLVQRFKYAGDLASGRWLAERLAERTLREPRADCLVAPPLSPARLRERGFNQAVEIARIVGAATRTPVLTDGIAKLRDTLPQTRLGRSARQGNPGFAFACGRDLSGQRVAIVDDVVTTGATARALARVLRGAGAASVSVWAVARALAPAAPA